MVWSTPLCRPSNTTMMQGEAFKTNAPSQCKRCPLHQAFSEDSRPRMKRNCEDDRKGWVTNGFSHGIIGSYNASSSFNSNAGQHFCHQPTRTTCSHWEQSSRKWGKVQPEGLCHGPQGDENRDSLALHLPAWQELMVSPFVLDQFTCWVPLQATHHGYLKGWGYGTKTWPLNSHLMDEEVHQLCKVTID